MYSGKKETCLHRNSDWKFIAEIFIIARKTETAHIEQLQQQENPNELTISVNEESRKFSSSASSGGVEDKIFTKETGAAFFHAKTLGLEPIQLHS